jgi:hypothetical protein
MATLHSTAVISIIFYQSKDSVSTGSAGNKNTVYRVYGHFTAAVYLSFKPNQFL